MVGIRVSVSVRVRDRVRASVAQSNRVYPQYDGMRIRKADAWLYY